VAIYEDADQQSADHRFLPYDHFGDLSSYVIKDA